MKREKTLFVISALCIPVTLFGLFTLSPLIQAIWYSFTNWTAFSTSADFVGLANFERALRDAVFWKALGNNGILVLIVPIATISISLFLASMLNVGGGMRVGGPRPARGSEFFRVAYFLPQVLSIAVLSIMWQNILAPSQGLLNTILRSLGMEHPPAWLVDEKTALLSVAVVSIWSAVGFYVVIFNAAMAGVNRDLYEAALIDGATAWSQFWRITIPSIKQTLIVAFIWSLIGALDAFALVQVMTVGPGGPNYSTTVVGYYIYTTAFREANYGYASALAVIMAILTVTAGGVVALINRSGAKRELRKAKPTVARAAAGKGTIA